MKIHLVDVPMLIPHFILFAREYWDKVKVLEDKCTMYMPPAQKWKFQ